MTSQSSGAGGHGFIAYVSCAGGGDISVLRLVSADEPASVIQKITIVEGAEGESLSTPMAVSADRRHLHAALRTPPLPIASFSIDRETGALTPLGTARIPASTPYVATERTGRFALTAANPGATVAVSRIGEDGRVAPRAHQVVHIGHKLHCIVVDRANRQVCVSSTDDGVIHVFRFDAGAGLLAPADPPLVQLADGGDPRHMEFSPDGRFLYVVTEAGGRIAVFSVDPGTGRLDEQAGISVMPEEFSGRASTADLHLTPDGRFIYASVRSLNTIVACRVDERSGALSAIASYPTEANPRTFAVAPDGRFLVVAGQDSGRMTAYGIDQADGTLSPGFSMAIGTRPNWIEIVDLATAH